MSYLIESTSYIPTSASKGQSFANWSVSVSKDMSKAGDFVVAPNGDSNGYTDAFVNLTRSYIKDYDTNGDGVISFDEFVKKETEIAVSNNAEAPSKSVLKSAFDKLNVEKTGEYAKMLSEKEIFSYFVAMDSLSKADGIITSEEYAMTALSLADTSTKKDAPGAMVGDYLKDVYSNIFGKKD